MGFFLSLSLCVLLVAAEEYFQGTELRNLVVGPSKKLLAEQRPSYWLGYGYSNSPLVNPFLSANFPELSGLPKSLVLPDLLETPDSSVKSPGVVMPGFFGLPSFMLPGSPETLDLSAKSPGSIMPKLPEIFRPPLTPTGLPGLLAFPESSTSYEKSPDLPESPVLPKLPEIPSPYSALLQILGLPNMYETPGFLKTGASAQLPKALESSSIPGVSMLPGPSAPLVIPGMPKFPSLPFPSFPPLPEQSLQLPTTYPYTVSQSTLPHPLSSTEQRLNNSSLPLFSYQSPLPYLFPVLFVVEKNVTNEEITGNAPNRHSPFPLSYLAANHLFPLLLDKKNTSLALEPTSNVSNAKPPHAIAADTPSYKLETVAKPKFKKWKLQHSPSPNAKPQQPCCTKTLPRNECNKKRNLTKRCKIKNRCDRLKYGCNPKCCQFFYCSKCFCCSNL